MGKNRQLKSSSYYIVFLLITNFSTSGQQNAPEQLRITKQFEDIQLVFIPGGTFEMGDTRNEGDSDEKPVHQVTVSSFYMGKYEVTQRQWRTVMGGSPSVFKDCEDCPVENVSWNDVQIFLEKLNTLTNGNYRLPTEAEWMYAADGGATNRTRFGNGKDTLKPSECNYFGSIQMKYDIAGEPRQTTTPAGSFIPNALGLYDMAGNVYEWCSDFYGQYSSIATTNPQGPKEGNERILLGGAWGNVSPHCRIFNRFNISPRYKDSNTGFRLVAQQIL